MQHSCPTHLVGRAHLQTLDVPPSDIDNKVMNTLLLLPAIWTLPGHDFV